MADDTSPPRPRPLTRAQTVENAAFLAALKRTGNAREAARSLGLNRSMLTKRRVRHPAFAARWDAALAFAHARLSGRPDAPRPRDDARLVRTASGRVQLRRMPPGKLTPAAEQAFLAALSATANVRLSAAAAGFAHSTFYARARVHPGFAREMRLALETGYRRLEEALLESFLAECHDHDGWRHNDPPPIPAMTANQALQLMYLHQKEAVLGGTPEPLRRRRGKSSDVTALRLQLIVEQRRERDREAFRVAEAAREARGEPRWLPPDPDAPVLPALDQVTGWSKASGRPAFDEGRALFGGRRLGEWEE